VQKKKKNQKRKMSICRALRVESKGILTFFLHEGGTVQDTQQVTVEKQEEKTK
jgi:hypothetical protein